MVLIQELNLLAFSFKRLAMPTNREGKATKNPKYCDDMTHLEDEIIFKMELE
jgi:hypothetical protein